MKSALQGYDTLGMHPLLMLSLRCIHINGDWDHFMKFHIEEEQKALYPVRAANDSAFYRPMVA